MLEVEPPVSVVTGSGRNGNEAVAGDASEAFARWLHHQRALHGMPRLNRYRQREHIVSKCVN